MSILKWEHLGLWILAAICWTVLSIVTSNVLKKHLDNQGVSSYFKPD